MARRGDVDAVVVGSGPNGLVAAARLAEAGLRVLVLEAQPTYGGGLRTEELTLPGFRHDVCSSVHPLALASPAFRALDLAREGLAFAHPEVPLAHPLDGTTALLHRDLGLTAEGLGRDGAAWRRLVGGVARGEGALVDGILDPLRLPPRHPVAMAGYGLLGVWPAAPLGRALFRDEPARALLAGVAAHAILPLEAAATTAYAMLLAGLAHAVGWPVAVGGSASIADALVARITALGGEVRTGTPVSSLDELPPARAVLLDLTPRQVLRVAGGAFPPRYRDRLARFRYGSGVFKVDWALDGPVPWRDPDVGRSATVHLGGSLRSIAASEAAIAQGEHPDEPYVLFVQATVADPTRAPAGRHTGWAYCHVPHGSRVDMTETIERVVERAAPGFRDRILARSTLDTAALHAHDANEIGGDIAGGAGDWRQLLTRPVASLSPWRTPVDGLYLCSASTPPGGGVHGMCGWNAAELALRDL
ncbi:MAG: FAD-dependent oxidoreductase [Frankiales bacterium]|nr:FAD-dependent oxidoreductase [Frankiales bacterium]